MKTKNLFKMLLTTALLVVASCGGSNQSNETYEEPNPKVEATTIKYYYNQIYSENPKPDEIVVKDHKYVYLLGALENNPYYVFIGWENRAEEKIYRPGEKVYFTVDVSLYAYWAEACSNCSGKGNIDIYEECSDCHGEGHITKPWTYECPNCHGGGQVEDRRMCDTCHGASTLDIYRCNYGHTYYAQYFGDYVTLCPYCANLGRTSIMTTSGKRDCPYCNDGYIDYGYKTCGTCNGVGTITSNFNYNCERCSNSGQILTSVETCSLCHGSKLEKHEFEPVVWINGNFTIELSDTSMHISQIVYSEYFGHRFAISTSKDLNPYFDLDFQKGTHTFIAETIEGTQIYSEDYYFNNLIKGQKYYLYATYIFPTDKQMENVYGPYAFTPGVGYSTTIEK